MFKNAMTKIDSTGKYHGSSFLYIISINDLPDYVNSMCKIFSKYNEIFQK